MLTWFRHAQAGTEGRRRLNLFRVARLIECDIGFLLALRPSSWYPATERRGKFKTRHASTTLQKLPLIPNGPGAEGLLRSARLFGISI